MIRFLTPKVAKRYRGETCLLRVDFNVALGAEDTTNRVDAVIPTIRLLLKHSIRVVLMAHRGRPVHKSKISPYGGSPEGRKNQKLKLSLKSFAPILAKKLGTKVEFYNHFNFQKLNKGITNSKYQVHLLENLRFLPGEERNDRDLARQLAELGNFYVNDAFAVSHRKNASVVAITKFLPSYGGLRLKEELSHLNNAMKRPRHPFVIVVGGAKVGDKLTSMKGIVRKADAILLGSSVFSERRIPKFKNLVWPDDIYEHRGKAWDIGPFTAKRYAALIAQARTIVWNGPVGFYEKKGFETGTIGIWKAILTKSQKLPPKADPPQAEKTKSCVIIGGGETIASLSLLKANSYKLKTNVFLSTGGGAMLAYLAGEKLPGIACLAEAGARRREALKR